MNYMERSPEATQAFQNMQTNSSESSMATVQQLLVLFYDQTSSTMNVNDSRNLFTRRKKNGKLTQFFRVEQVLFTKLNV